MNLFKYLGCTLFVLIILILGISSGQTPDEKSSTLNENLKLLEPNSIKNGSDRLRPLMANVSWRLSDSLMLSEVAKL